MKKLISIVLAIIFLIGCSKLVSVPSPDASSVIDTSEIKIKTDKFIESLLSKEMIDFGKSQNPFWYMEHEWQAITIISKQNLSSHNFFDWHWAEHVAILIYSDTLTPGTRAYLSLTFMIKEYQEFVTVKSKGFILYNIKNHFAICNPEYIEIFRDYRIVCGGNIIAPAYPKGFIDTTWYNLTPTQSVKKYEEVLDYWINKIEIGETEEERRERILDSLIPEEDC